MKTRQGFVSNSSSSSFIVAFPKGKTNKEIESRIIEALKIPEDSPLYWLSKDIAGVFTNYYYELDIEDYEEGDHIYDETKRLEAKGFEVHHGSASNEDSDIAENLVCDMDLMIDEPTLYIWKGGGY